MASTLDKALDDIIKGKRTSRRSNGPKRSSGSLTSRDGARSGGVRKRTTQSNRLGATFVRTVQLRGDKPSVSDLWKDLTRMATDLDTTPCRVEKDVT